MYFGATCLALALYTKLQPLKEKRANDVEAFLLLTQTITLALGGMFTFGIVDTSSLIATLVSFVLIFINYYKLFPLLHEMLYPRNDKLGNMYRKAATNCKKCPRACKPLADAFVEQEDDLSELLGDDS